MPPRPLQIPEPHKQFFNCLFAWVHIAHRGFNVIVASYVLQRERVRVLPGLGQKAVPQRMETRVRVGLDLFASGSSYSRMGRPFEKVSTAARRWTTPIPLCTLLVLRSLVPSMRFITFDDPVRRSRIGALAPDGRIVDLNSACALYLRDVENEGAYDRISAALVPPNMRKLFEGGDTS